MPTSLPPRARSLGFSVASLWILPGLLILPAVGAFRVEITGAEGMFKLSQEQDEEIRERVFDSFFTTKDVGRGTGLGLATAHRIVVDRHRGTLTVDSEPGATTFHVWLPLTQ